jgi:hypothetical protein
VLRAILSARGNCHCINLICGFVEADPNCVPDARIDLADLVEHSRNDSLESGGLARKRCNLTIVVHSFPPFHRISKPHRAENRALLSPALSPLPASDS